MSTWCSFWLTSSYNKLWPAVCHYKCVLPCGLSIEH